MQEARKTKRRASIMLTMEQETKDRLQAIARQRHTTVSQLITDFAWKTRLRPEPEEAE